MSVILKVLRDLTLPPKNSGRKPYISTHDEHLLEHENRKREELHKQMLFQQKFLGCC